MASNLFRDMLGDERLGGPKEGTEENPIRIEKITSVSLSQVKAFCKVMNWRSVFSLVSLPLEERHSSASRSWKGFQCRADVIDRAMV